MADETQFCLRWNNFQANITSQFETLRDDEDFTDVTIACEGQRLQAHKVVLSACSPFFKELFKTNPCSHPIIFMRDVKAHDVVALMEFMYAGEVNVAQAHLPTFLKTAESLKIRGLTETSNRNDGQVEEEQNSKQLESSSPSSTVTSTQQDNISNLPEITIKKSSNFLKYDLQTKVELPDCLSDEDHNFFPSATEAMEVVQAPAVVPAVPEGASSAPVEGTNRRLHSLDPRRCEECGRIYSNLSNLRQHMKLIHFPTYVQCSLCKKPFKTDLYLRRHVMTAHSSSSFAPPAQHHLQQANFDDYLRQF